MVSSTCEENYNLSTTENINDPPINVIETMEERNEMRSSSETEKFEQPLKYWLWERKDVKWLNVFFITFLHAMVVYVLLTVRFKKHWMTLIWTIFVGYSAAFGITGGIHRYWTHKSYKASFPLKIILTLCYLAAGQNSIYDWVRDHRLHHKYSETEADPHNSNRGFFFSHVGWLMLKKNAEVISKGRQIDMSDVLADPVASFCDRHFVLLKTMVCFVIPITVPVYFWGEDWYWSTVYQLVRYTYVLNATWSVNSFAHIFGNKPYDKKIAPVENKYVSYATFGEGWHNYHHAFPSDYRAAEIGGGRFNTTTSIIDFFAKINWAYDRKVPPASLVEMTVTKRGDGSHTLSNQTVNK